MARKLGGNIMSRGKEEKQAFFSISLMLLTSLPFWKNADLFIKQWEKQGNDPLQRISWSWEPTLSENTQIQRHTVHCTDTQIHKYTNNTQIHKFINTKKINEDTRHKCYYRPVGNEGPTLNNGLAGSENQPFPSFPFADLSQNNHNPPLLRIIITIFILNTFRETIFSFCSIWREAEPRVSIRTKNWNLNPLEWDIYLYPTHPSSPPHKKLSQTCVKPEAEQIRGV